MHPKTEQRIAAQLSKTLAMVCVRNTFIENIHAGKVPVTKTGDYSDVKIVDGEGTEISWAEVSRISDEEIKIFMKQVVNRLYTWYLKNQDIAASSRFNLWHDAAQHYDDPTMDQGLLSLIDNK